MDDLFWLTVALFVLAAALRSELFFYLLYLVAGLQIAARLWVWRGARRVSWRRVAPPAAFPEEPLEVELEIANASLLPLPWLAIHESIPPALRTPPAVREVLSLAPGERRTLRYTLSGQQRGYYRLGPMRVELGDVLGFGEQAVHGDTTTPITIYPRVLPLHELGLPAALPYGTMAAQQRLFTDPARPAGLRPYQPTDGVRQIDWKSTARAGAPMVRRHQPAIALETMVALAFSPDDYPRRFAYDLMERAASAAASIAVFLGERSQAVGLCATGIDAATGAPLAAIPSGAGRAHLIALLGALGRLEPAQGAALPALLPQAASGLGWGGTLVVITGRCDRDLIAALLPMRRRGLSVALVLAEPAPEDLALPRAHGIAPFALWRDGRPERG